MKNKVICFWSRKGGTGKTISSIATFDYLNKKSFRTLFIDADEQCNATLFLGLNQSKKTILDIFNNGNIKNCITHTERGDIIACHDELSEYEISNIDILYNAIQSIENEYDYIVIDCPPSNSDISINALYSSNCIVIPTQTEEGTLQGLAKLNSLTIPKINHVRLQQGLPVLKIEGLLITQYNPRNRYNVALLSSLESMAVMLNTKIFKTKIRQNTTLNEAKLNRQSIFDYDPQSNGAIDYQNFVEELIKE